MKAARSDIIFAAERRAAGMLDLKPCDFLALVNDGILPKPTLIGNHKRWDVEQLQSIVRGDAADGLTEVVW